MCVSENLARPHKEALTAWLLPMQDDSAEAEEVCEVCNKADKKRGRRFVELLECDRCLRGYHLDCLEPPLDAVPEVLSY